MSQATINLLPKQTEAFEYFEDATTTELGYGGAAGGGKTRLGWYIFLPAALQYPGSKWGIGRKELKTLRMTTLATGWEILAELGMKKERDYGYNAQDGVFTFPNGSQIILIDTAYSPQDPEYTRFGGYELTGDWIDESNETPAKAKAILKTRIGRKNRGKLPDGSEWTLKPFHLETFNPDKGHVYQDYYKPYRDGNLPPFRRFVPALPGDNPHLPEAYIENLRRADKITRERLLLGNFDYDDDPNRLINYDAITDLFTNTIVKETKRYITCDVARHGVDKTVIMVWEGFEVIKHQEYARSDIDEIVRILRGEASTYQVPYSQIIADEDGVGGGVIDGMRGIKGFMGNSRPFDVIDTRTGKMVPAYFKNLRAQAYKKLADFINAHQMAVRIDDTDVQEKLSEELGVIKRKNADKEQAFQIISKPEMKEYLGRSPDYADTLMMRMYFELASPRIIQQQIDPVQIILNKNRATRINGSEGAFESMV